MSDPDEQRRSLPDPKTLPKRPKPAKPTKARRQTPAERREQLRLAEAAARSATNDSAWGALSDAARNQATADMLCWLDEIFEASPRKPGGRGASPADPRVIVLSKWQSLPQPIIDQIISLVEPFEAWANKSAAERGREKTDPADADYDSPVSKETK